MRCCCCCWSDRVINQKKVSTFLSLFQHVNCSFLQINAARDVSEWVSAMRSGTEKKKWRRKSKKIVWIIKLNNIFFFRKYIIGTGEKWFSHFQLHNSPLSLLLGILLLGRNKRKKTVNKNIFRETSIRKKHADKLCCWTFFFGWLLSDESLNKLMYYRGWPSESFEIRFRKWNCP